MFSHTRCSASIDERIDSTLFFGEQMLQILTEIANAGCAFTDMKLENWLINFKGELVIADNKSLAIAEGNQLRKSDFFRANLYPIIHSPHLTPPEFNTDERSSVDRIHAYLFGKNLYEYITAGDFEDLYEKQSATGYNFDLDVFKTSCGKRLQQLIEALVVPDVSQRMSSRQALKELKKISALFANAKIERGRQMCFDVLEEIRLLGLQAQDFKIAKRTVAAFILEKAAEVAQGNLSQLPVLEESLRRIKFRLQEKIIIDQAKTLYTPPVQQLASDWAPRSERDTTLCSLRQKIADLFRADNTLLEAMAANFGLNIEPPENKLDAMISYNTRLQKALIMALQNENSGLLSQIKSCTTLRKDTEMEQFVEAQDGLLRTTALKELHENNQQLCMVLQGQHVTGLVMGIVSGLRKQTGFFSIGCSAKADAIERCLRQVSIAERWKVGNSQHAEADEVVKALAAHRITPQKRVAAVDEQCTVNSYRLFMTGLKKLKPYPDTGDNFLAANTEARFAMQ